ncbi:MAG: hypothetical protein NTZ34_02730, partial [Chloroflexi bacterium]|nr:hypothetical protein [Chloroflexota bacterium]
RKPSAAQTERDFQLKAWIKTGVSPRGAQVRRTEGRWETPLSSWKKIQAFRRRAFFLPRAISPRSSIGSPRDCVPELAGRVVGGSNPSPRGSSKHDQGDNGRRSAVG